MLSRNAVGFVSMSVCMCRVRTSERHYEIVSIEVLLVSVTLRSFRNRVRMNRRIRTVLVH